MLKINLVVFTTIIVVLTQFEIILIKGQQPTNTPCLCQNRGICQPLLNGSYFCICQGFLNKDIFTYYTIKL